MPRFARTVWFAIAAVLGSSLLSLVLAEGVLAALGVWPAISAEYLFVPPVRKVLDRSLIAVPQRLLEPERYQTPADARTIVALGDSFTAGDPWGEDYGYPVMLERLLAQAGQNVKVINAGHGDSGPDQQHRLLHTVVLPQTEPSIIVWQFFFNDIGNNYVFPTYDLDDAGNLLPLDASGNWLYLRQQFYSTMPLPIEWKNRSRVLRLGLQAFERLRGQEAPSQGYSERNRWARDKIRAELADFQRLADQRGFRPYVVLATPQVCYLPAPETTSGVSQWTYTERQNGDLRALLAAQPGFIEIYFPNEDPGALFTTDESAIVELGARHYSVDGYRLMAEAIAERILSDDAAEIKQR